MIYGAAGYTGRLVAEHAAALGLELVLAGRPGSRLAIEEMADELRAETRFFSLDDGTDPAHHLAGTAVLLNAAGPFADSAEPLMSAAIRAKVHYLDFSAELDTYREAMALDTPAQAAGVMLMPGSGGSVAMLGTLASLAVSRTPNPRRIAIALEVAGGMSRGSVASASRSIVAETLRLADGHLVERSAVETRSFDFGEGPLSCFPATLPDLLTIRHATGVSDIKTYVHISEGAFPSSDTETNTSGPTAAEREANRYHASVEVEADNGSIVRMALDTVNGYTFTAIAAAEAARRVLAGDVRPGYRAPVEVFGGEFALTIGQTSVSVL